MFYRIKQLRHFIWRTKELYRRANRAEILGKTKFARVKNSFLINVKENIDVRGSLDYPGREIVMDANAYVLVNRLNACKKEPDTVSWIEHTLKPGDVFYDVGASIGVYSFIAWGKTKGKSRVFAFEPSFSSYATLCRNIYLNRAEGAIAAFPIAFSEHTDIFPFHYSGIEPSRAKHYLETSRDAPRQGNQYMFSHSVLSFSLDEFVSLFKLPFPSVMKIDVDGAEGSLIKGAMKTLAHPSLRSLQIEIDEHIPDFKATIRLLEQAGLCRVLRTETTQKGIANYVFDRNG